MKQGIFFSLIFTFLITASTSVYAESSLTIYGLTSSGSIAKFSSADTSTITTTPIISGLQSSESIVAIDFRPADNLLYGVGSSSRLYKLDKNTAVATLVGDVFSTTLVGTLFGADFNPAVDRLRIISNLDQNIRINPANGELTAADTAVAYDAIDTNNGVDPSIIGVAYSNNLAGTTSTTAMGVDSALGILVRVGGPNGSPSPNGGVLTSLGSLGLGTNLTNVGFDIIGGKTTGSQLGVLVATLNGETASKLFSLDLAGGAATLLGSIGGGVSLLDIAASINDEVSPIGLISVVQRVRISDLRRRGISASFSCSELCTVSGSLAFTAGAASRLGLSTSGPVTIATASSNLADAGTGNLLFTISSDASNALVAAANRGDRRFRMDLTLTITDAGGNVTTVTKSVETI